LYSHQDAQLHGQELQAIKELRHWQGVQESILKRKAREEWVKLGDSNTKDFYSVMKQRLNRNRIDAIMTEQGHLEQSPNAIQQERLKFYKSLLGSRADSLPQTSVL
jgi:hypothetical protein